MNPLSNSYAPDASRKSARRDDGEIHPGGVPAAPFTSLPLLPELNAVSPAVQASASSGWGASLPPRGYSAACRVAEQEALHARTSPQPRLPAQPNAERWKRRRTEQVTFASLAKEVFMYLDAVAATRQDQLTPVSSQGGAEEDADAEGRRGRRGISVHSVSSPPQPPVTHNQYAAPPFHVTTTSTHDINGSGGSSAYLHGSAYGGRGGGAAPAVAVTTNVPPVSVDAAVADTLRVLRACWEYRGSPHDAFEPVRLLSPVTVHLLTTYGHHVISHDGEYVVLRGGPEQLPWVGCLYGILQSYICRRHARRHDTVTDDTAEASVLPGISRVLLLNCHSFGWLDHVGSDEYERSHRHLYQAREALSCLLEDERYASLGCHAACPLCSATMVGGDGSTAVLLGDTIVMEGGAPSLGLASARNTFTAHYQYGRGIACCVPERRAPLLAKNAAGATPASHRGNISGGVGGRRERVAPTVLCAAHASVLGEVRRRCTSRWPSHPSPHASQSEEEVSARGGPRVSPPSPLYAPPLSSPSLVVTHFPPVCCGTCRAAGVLGQALLLGPTGPLLIHLQFEEREWVEAAAPFMSMLGGEGTAFGQAVPGGWPMAETTAVCPAPRVHTTALPTDPASALAAVLYAQMQGHDTTGLTQPPSAGTVGGACGRTTALPRPPLASIPGGGAVSLAEFVEWLVGLLHAPPPALVVEWHSGPPAASSTGAGPPSPSSAASSPYPELTASGMAAHAPASTASSAEQQQQQGHHPTPVHGHRYSSPPAPPPSAPLGMSVHPRHPVVPLLLATYADVMASRPPAAPTAATGRETRVPGATLAGASSTTLQSVLATASQQVEERDRVLLAWVLAAREGLQPCEATTYFDGVERPLVLGKGLEVVAEGERYVSATSVVTSLQFRPRPTGSSGLDSH